MQYLWGPPGRWAVLQSGLCHQDYNSQAGWLPSRSDPTSIFSASDRDTEVGKTSQLSASPIQKLCHPRPWGLRGHRLRKMTCGIESYWMDGLKVTIAALFLECRAARATSHQRSRDGS